MMIYDVEIKNIKKELDDMRNDVYELRRMMTHREEAEFASARLNILREIKNYSCGVNEGMYMMRYDPSSDSIEVDSAIRCLGIPTFKYYDDVDECIKSVGKERLKKYFFMVED